eukprot:scaffold2063_cov114-Isochrysis_galbana.AAC.6
MGGANAVCTMLGSAARAAEKAARAAEKKMHARLTAPRHLRSLAVPIGLRASTHTPPWPHSGPPLPLR